MVLEKMPREFHDVGCRLSDVGFDEIQGIRQTVESGVHDRLVLDVFWSPLGSELRGHPSVAVSPFEQFLPNPEKNRRAAGVDERAMEIFV